MDAAIGRQGVRRLYHCAPEPRPLLPGPQRQRVSFSSHVKPPTTSKQKHILRGSLTSGDLISIAKICTEAVQPAVKLYQEYFKFKATNMVEVRRNNASLPVLRGMVTQKNFFSFTIIHGMNSEQISYTDILELKVIYMEEALDLWMKLQSTFLYLEKPILHLDLEYDAAMFVIQCKRKPLQWLQINLLAAWGNKAFPGAVYKVDDGDDIIDTILVRKDDVHGCKDADGDEKKVNGDIIGTILVRKDDVPGNGRKPSTGGHGCKAADGDEKKMAPEVGTVIVETAAPRTSTALSFRVFVHNLPWKVDDSRLKQVFSEHVKVLNAWVVLDKESGSSRGFGFVTVGSQSEVADAIAALDGQSLDGRPIRVRRAKERRRRRSF